MSTVTPRSHTVMRSITTTGRFFKTQHWVWPLIAAILLSVIGYTTRRAVEGSMKAKLAAELQTILNADVEALRIWLAAQEANARVAAARPEVVAAARDLLAISAASDFEPTQLRSAPVAAELREHVQPLLKAYDYNGYAILAPDGRLLAAQRGEAIGKNLGSAHPEVFASALAGTARVSRPFPSALVLTDARGIDRAGVPTMAVLAPIKQGDQVIAVFALRIRPDVGFTRILSVARSGESGETYAFDAQGLLLSQSRFDDELKNIALLPDRDDTQSILNIQIRDPGVDLTKREIPAARRSEQPLTRMAVDAVQGNTGFDVDGYRDYRGVPVIGAWTWLSDYGFGVASEVDVAEAYGALYLLRKTFGALFVLLILAAIAIFVFTLIVSRMQRRIRKAVLEAKHLGQYTLGEKIGAGGMGVVYRARHAMLRRDTAVKLLDVDKTSPTTIARFEREVQLTSQLNHPNTIAIYDYGRTPEGIFYYAMEYLDGLPLDHLVQRYGRQPEGRVVHILRQLCGSLAEAHGVSLIHRDIKPANIILNQRGGVSDVVKLLDFGLVKATDGQQEAQLTNANGITGTPLYMSPEAIERPEDVTHTSDLYAVGAVGYFLLTGQPLFDGGSVIEIVMQQTTEMPVPPSQRAGVEISPQLEELILACLAKKSADRPQHAAEIIEILDRCSIAWTQSDAGQWWQTHHADGRPTDVTSTPRTGGKDDETIMHDSAGDR